MQETRQTNERVSRCTFFIITTIVRGPYGERSITHWVTVFFSPQFRRSLPPESLLTLNFKLKFLHAIYTPPFGTYWQTAVANVVRTKVVMTLRPVKYADAKNNQWRLRRVLVFTKFRMCAPRMRHASVHIFISTASLRTASNDGLIYMCWVFIISAALIYILPEDNKQKRAAVQIDPATT
jgi:hypothetical protein